MKFISTRNKSRTLGFSQAVLNCMPADGGLYVPHEMEDLRRWILYTDEDTTFTSIAGSLTSAFINDEFSPIICETIATRAFPFAPEIRQLDESLFLMNLSTGPTGKHRDFGISYLAACLETILQYRGETSVFLGVSTGELGAMLARALRGKKRIRAAIVYPKGSVCGMEEGDFFWNGGNLFPVEIDGTEADCHDLVRKIFADRKFVEERNITVANTANIGRLLPQAFFYTFAFSRIKHKIQGDIFYALAPGNYSDVTAGLYSWQFALPLSGFILPATNELSVDALGNPVLLDSVVPLKERLPADPSEPSNLERLEDVFTANRAMMRHFIYPTDIDGRMTADAAKELFCKYKLFADRPTAQAYAAGKIRRPEEDEAATVLIMRDHPALSAEFVRHTVGELPAMPESIRDALAPMKLSRPCIQTAEELRAIIESL
ncbi:MAG: threonine synthase [Treponemataceae bacterium]|nr:threonine synthase [Treponemataceae bacterium]